MRRHIVMAALAMLGASARAQFGLDRAGHGGQKRGGTRGVWSHARHRSQLHPRPHGARCA